MYNIYNLRLYTYITHIYTNITWEKNLTKLGEKNNSTELFNVCMGSYNDEEMCDIGLFLLNEIKKEIYLLYVNLL